MGELGGQVVLIGSALLLGGSLLGAGWYFQSLTPTGHPHLCSLVPQEIA